MHAGASRRGRTLFENLSQAGSAADAPGAEVRLPRISRSHSVVAPVAAELPVFASPDGRRRRRVRLAGGAIATLIVLWLAALLAGALGFGALPGVPDLGSGDGASHRATDATPALAAPGRGAAPAVRLGASRASSTSAGGAAQPAQRNVSDGSQGGGAGAVAPASTGSGAATPGSGTSSATGKSKPSKSEAPGRRVGQSDATSSAGNGSGKADTPKATAPKAEPVGAGKGRLK